jgi:hypothetical protein
MHGNGSSDSPLHALRQLQTDNSGLELDGFVMSSAADLRGVRPVGPAAAQAPR